MKTSQLRFSRRFNLRNAGLGTLWEGVVPWSSRREEERALRTIAASIDLNPERDGTMVDAADYRWSGYSRLKVPSP